MTQSAFPTRPTPCSFHRTPIVNAISLQANKMVALERIKRAEAEEEAREANLEKEALRSALRLVEQQSIESQSQTSSQSSPSSSFDPQLQEGEVTRSRSSSNVAVKSPEPGAKFAIDVMDEDVGGTGSAGPTSPVSARATAGMGMFSSVPASPAPPSPAPLYVPPPQARENVSETSRPEESELVDEADVEAELAGKSSHGEVEKETRSRSPVTTPRPSTPTNSSRSPITAASTISPSQPTSASDPTHSPAPLPHPQLHRDRTITQDRFHARSPSPSLTPTLLTMNTDLHELPTNPERKRSSLHKQPVAPPPSAVSEGSSAGAPWADGAKGEAWGGEDDGDEDDGGEMVFSLASQELPEIEVQSPWADR